MKIHELKRDLSDGKLDVTLEKIYSPSAATIQRKCQLAAVDSFTALYPNIDKFLELVGQSGNSSYKLLQNIYFCKKLQEQGLALEIWESERVLNRRGAVRVYGGGFAGTIQAFVPRELEGEYRTEMERIFGAGSCKALRIRSYGGIRITTDKEGE